MTQVVDYENDQKAIVGLVFKYKLVPVVKINKKRVFIKGVSTEPFPEQEYSSIGFVSTFYELVIQLRKLLRRYQPIVEKKRLKKLFGAYKKFRKNNRLTTKVFDLFCRKLVSKKYGEVLEELNRLEKGFVEWLNKNHSLWLFESVQQDVTHLYLRYIFSKVKYGIQYHDLYKILNAKLRDAMMDAWNDPDVVNRVWTEENPKPQSLYEVDDTIMKYVFSRETVVLERRLSELFEFSKIVKQKIGSDVFSFLRWIKFEKPGWVHPNFPRLRVGDIVGFWSRSEGDWLYKGGKIMEFDYTSDKPYKVMLFGQNYVDVNVLVPDVFGRSVSVYEVGNDVRYRRRSVEKVGTISLIRRYQSGAVRGFLVNPKNVSRWIKAKNLITNGAKLESFKVGDEISFSKIVGNEIIKVKGYIMKINDVYAESPFKIIEKNGSRMAWVSRGYIRNTVYSLLEDSTNVLESEEMPPDEPPPDEPPPPEPVMVVPEEPIVYEHEETIAPQPEIFQPQPTLPEEVVPPQEEDVLETISTKTGLNMEDVVLLKNVFGRETFAEGSKIFGNFTKIQWFYRPNKDFVIGTYKDEEEEKGFEVMVQFPSDTKEVTEMDCVKHPGGDCRHASALTIRWFIDKKEALRRTRISDRHLRARNRTRMYRWGTGMPEMIRIPREKEKVVRTEIQKDIIDSVEDNIQSNNEIIREKEKVIQDNNVIQEAMQEAAKTPADTEQEQIERDEFLEKSQERLNENEGLRKELNRELTESNTLLDELQSSLVEARTPGQFEDSQIKETEKRQKEVEQLSQKDVEVVEKQKGKMRFDHVYWLDNTYPCILKNPKGLPKDLMKGKRDYIVLHFDEKYQWLSAMQARKDLKPFYVDDPEIESNRKICEFLKVRVHPRDIDTYMEYIKQAKATKPAFKMEEKDEIEEEIKLYYDEKIADVVISSLEDENDQLLDKIIQEEFDRVNVFTSQRKKELEKDKKELDIEVPKPLIEISPKWKKDEITLKTLEKYIKQAFDRVVKSELYSNKTIRKCIDKLDEAEYLFKISTYSGIVNKDQGYLERNSKKILKYIDERLETSKKITKCVKTIKEMKKPKTLIESDEFEEFLSVLEFLNNVFKHSVEFLHNNLKIALLRNDIQTDEITELYEEAKREELEADSKELDRLEKQDEEEEEDYEEEEDWDKFGEEEFVPEEEEEEEDEEEELSKINKNMMKQLKRDAKRIAKVQNNLKNQRKLREKKRKELQAEQREKKRKKRKKKRMEEEEIVVDCAKYSDDVCIEQCECRIFSSIMFHPKMSAIFPFNKNNKVYGIGGKVSAATKALKGFLDLAKGARKLAGNAQKFYTENKGDINDAYTGLKTQVIAAKKIAEKYGVTQKSVMNIVKKGIEGKGAETQARLREIKSLSETAGTRDAVRIISLREKIKTSLKKKEEPMPITVPRYTIEAPPPPQPLMMMPQQQPQMFPMQSAFYYFCPTQPQTIPRPIIQRPQMLPTPQIVQQPEGTIPTAEEKEKKERVVRTLAAIRDRLRTFQ
jgi:hypothetical protein